MPNHIRDAIAAADYPDPTVLADPVQQRHSLDALSAGIPGLDALLAEARSLVDATGGVIVENCAIQPDEAVAVLSSAFGPVVVAGNGIPSALVFDVTPRPTASGLSDAGTSRGTGEFGLHSDSANFARPHAFVALGCVRAEVGHGGESLLVSAEAIASTLFAEDRRHSLRALAEPVFPFPNHEGIVHGPILWHTNGRWWVRYREPASTAADRWPGLDEPHTTALADFEAVLRRPDLVAEFVLRPGDLFVLDNRRWLHGRRAFTAAANRLLKRCKMLLPPEGVSEVDPGRAPAPAAP
ncbi:TauD/TfdA family dioxygenase [Plantactinospora sp. WMMC1484]|uniref:TauD/TfdA family dioxygenase n=1 Tax=Plantactinospora sp. WMMC1484 TaxID=3404122 RepID=UPI003BF4E60E